MSKESKDYYQILEIQRESNEADIAKAYRKLSLRWHPKLSKEDYNTTYHNFCLISEAYEVLSDPIKRTFFDKYGEEKLKEGFFTNGNLKGGYRFAGNPESIFESFFGTQNPFAQLIDTDGSQAHGSLLSHAFGAQDYPGIKPPVPLEVNVECSLNEIYLGCAKKISYQKTILNKDGRTTKEITETKELQIKAGIQEGQYIIFNEQGNQAAGQKACNYISILLQITHQQSAQLKFKIVILPHPNFKRKGQDLIYIAKINLSNAICADSLVIKTLDNRNLQISIDEIISPKTIREIQGEGMPIFQVDDFKVENFGSVPNKGNLYIRFDIQFPTSLTEEKKAQIKEILKDSY